jgi:hypothetical protein
VTGEEGHGLHPKSSQSLPWFYAQTSTQLGQTFTYLLCHILCKLFGIKKKELDRI